MNRPVWRALIVDDDDALCSVLSYKLRKSGFEPRAVGDGLAALELLRDGGFDALLLDIMMPRLDGFQVLRALHNGEIPAPKVTFVLSGRAGEEDQLRALELGAADYIAKPFSVAVLVAKLRRALELATSVPAGTVSPAVESAAQAQEAAPAGGPERVAATERKAELG